MEIKKINGKIKISLDSGSKFVIIESENKGGIVIESENKKTIISTNNKKIGLEYPLESTSIFIKEGRLIKDFFELKC